MDGLLTAVLDPHGRLQNWATRQSQTTTPIRFSTSTTHSCSGAWTIHLTLQVSRRSHTTHTITKHSLGSCFRCYGSCTSTTQTASQTTDYDQRGRRYGGVIGSMCRVSLDEIEYADGRRFRRGPSKRRVYAALARLRLNHRAVGGLDDEERGRRAEQGKRTDRVRLQARDLHLVMRPVARGTSVDFAYSPMDSRPALLTELTLTNKATARLPNSGCIS